MLSLLPCDSLIDTALDYYIKKMVSIGLKLGFIKAGFKKKMNMTEQALKSCFTALQGVEGNTEGGIKTERNAI